MGRPFVALLGVLAAGCMSASVHQFGNQLRPPRPPELIEVLEQAPEEPHSVIASIECRTGAVYHDVDDLRRKLIEEAAKLGGDALVLGRVHKDSQPILLGTAMIMSEEKRLRADVIVFDRADEPDPGSGASGGD